ncbi:FxSxx-COOH system tetratricopeptide repeat protein [Streptomyces sp. NPDC002763]|uniref:FxSxx-COOH system tetratricopeptide repeat protein n=1 Tax=Streptomyces sp. NPDC002763 TaxID=3154427 RepID=UPI003325621B
MNGHAEPENANAVDADEAPLLIEPVVAWPRQAETDCDYLVTVDLRGPLPAVDATEPDWPWREEEFTFTVTLEGAPLLACAALDEPAVVLHRFGGTYGPARFAVSTGSEPGAASLWLTISNQWGVPVRKAELRSEIREREPGGPPAAGPALDQPVITTVPADRGRRGSRGALSRLLGAGGPDEQPEAGTRAEASPPPRRDGQTQPAGPDGRETITISFAGFNRAWAAWIGYQLERRGVRVRYVRWDAPAEIPLINLLRDLALAQGRVLVIVSDRYFRLGTRTHEEWNAALHEVVAPDPSRFAAVSITNAAVPSAIAVLAPVELTGISADEAERRLLDRMHLPADVLPEPSGGPRGPRFPFAVPEVWGGVPRRNTRFTGREGLLNAAYHRLQGSEPDAGVLTLHGMSGVGKTQLAAEYVYRFGSEYDVVWWVNAEKRVTYRRLLAELAPRLGLSTGEEYGERLRAVREALRRGEPYSRWLLVLDGADDPDQIGDLIPTGPGHVIITSRNPEWADYHSRLLDVPVYDRDESVAFIRLRAPRLTEADADQLAEALEDLPLLLDQTAGWLDDSELSVPDYIALLDSGLDQEVVKVSADFPLAFQTAWSILLNKLRDTVPESVDLLRLCTFFAPGFIPVHLLREMPRDGLPDHLAGLLDDPLLWARAIDQLRRYSVVGLESYLPTPDEAPSTGDALYLHRMVHRIVHQDMTTEELRSYGDVVRGALAAADPGRPSDSRDWSAYAEIVPHLRYADALRSGNHGVQTLVLNSLRYLLFIGEYAEGIELGLRALEFWRALLGESHPQIWELTYHYANLLRADGHYARTEAIERATVQRLREERGPDDLDHLRMASGLAADLRGLGRYEEALELSRSLHTAYRDLLGEEDSRTLNALNNLGFSLRQLGRYGQALEIDRQTLEARRRILSRRHVFTLFSEVSYAVDLRLMGRYVEAETIQTMNVREHGFVLGPDNPQTLRAEHNLALCHYRSGDYERADSLLTRVLERYDRKLGETHLETLGAAVSQSCFVREHGDLGQAREASEILVARYEQLLPVGHPFITGVRANHALVMNAVGEREGAHALIEQALADMTAAVEEQHPYTLGCAINASAVRNAVGDTESAAELSRRTVARATETLGRTHPLTLSARIALADDLRGLRDRQQADKIEQDALADLAATLGPQHPHTLSARTRTRPHWDFEPQTT